MPTTSIEIKDVPTRLPEVLENAKAGTEVIITQGNVPRARLFLITPQKERVLGLHAGAYEIADDFDAPLPDEIMASFLGEEPRTKKRRKR